MRVFYVAACKNALFLFSLQACNSLHSGKNNIASITIGIVLKTGITQTFLLLFWAVSYLDFRAVLYSLEGKPWHGNTHTKQCSSSTTKNHKHICSAKQISILKHIVSHPTLTHNTHFFMQMTLIKDCNDIFWLIIIFIYCTVWSVWNTKLLQSIPLCIMHPVSFSFGVLLLVLTLLVISIAKMMFKMLNIHAAFCHLVSDDLNTVS